MTRSNAPVHIVLMRSDGEGCTASPEPLPRCLAPIAVQMSSLLTWKNTKERRTDSSSACFCCLFSFRLPSTRCEGERRRRNNDNKKKSEFISILPDTVAHGACSGSMCPWARHRAPKRSLQPECNSDTSPSRLVTYLFWFSFPTHADVQGTPPPPLARLDLSLLNPDAQQRTTKARSPQVLRILSLLRLRWW